MTRIALAAAFAATTFAAANVQTAAAQPSNSVQYPAFRVGLVDDTRRCAEPLCGGWHYRDADFKLTQCHDGTYAYSCYAAEIDFSELNLTDEQIDEILEGISVEPVLFIVEPYSFDSGFGPLGGLKVIDIQRPTPI